MPSWTPSPGWRPTRSSILAATFARGRRSTSSARSEYRCLDECRSPLGLRPEPLARARPSGARRSRWGSRTALFCVGCCWSLMLVMFAVGLGSAGRMLALGAVTAVEKNTAWGRRLTTPARVVLLLAAVYSVAQ